MTHSTKLASVAPSPCSSEGAAANTLLGLQVNLPDRCRCTSRAAVISSGDDTHYAQLECLSCGRPRGWLSEHTARWIEAVAAKFGAPEIITLRRNSVAAATEQSPAEPAMTTE
jgi:hypothetical protein